MKRLWDSLAGNSDGDQKMRVLTDKVKFLDARASDIRKKAEHAVIQLGKKGGADVDGWLNTVEEKMTEYKNIKKEGQEQGFSLRLIGCIEKMTGEIQELIQQGVFPYGLVWSDNESNKMPLLVSEPVGEMFQINIERIMEWLKNSQQFMFGIYGMGGVGKTTLLMQIHDQLSKDSSIIGDVYWVTVSRNCSLHNLQQKIADVVGMCLSEKDEKKRAAVLHDRLGRKRRMVFILDDMWEASFVEDIGIPLGEGGCKVILTTRSLEVCREMGCGEFICEVKILERNEARNLFIDQLINYGSLTAVVKHIVDLVADECGCLPLAILTIGRCMRAFTCFYEWKNALDKLRNPSRGQGDSEDEVLQKLKFSYDRLGDKILQDCFLSCVLYPDDGILPKKELIEVWMMEGLLDDAGSSEEQLYKGHSILDKLVNSCLLEPDIWYKQRLKIHDLIRDMAMFITRKHPRFISKPRLRLKQVPKEEPWTEDLVKVSLFGNEITEIGDDMSPPPRCPKLSVLMLYGNPLKRIPESFFVHMTALTVLDLSYTPIERLPESVCYLENLRVILLKGCYNLRYVPSLAKLTKLRVLDLPLSVEMKESPSGMERLKCLEKLTYCRWNKSEWTYFNRLIESWLLSKLYCYHFKLHGGLNTVPHHSRVCEIHGSYDKEVMIKEAELGVQAVTPLLPLLPRTMEMLSIIGCEIQGRRSLTDVLPSLGGATELKMLKIEDCRGLHSVLSVSCDYSQLEILSLACLPDLQELIKFTLFSPPSLQPAAVNLSHLTNIHIEHCPRIKAVFQFKSLLHRQTPFPNLETVCVWHCKELEEIFEAPSSTTTTSSSSNSSCSSTATSLIVVNLPNLKSLELGNLPKLKNVYRGLLRCPSLISVTTRDCPELQEMLPLLKPLHR